MPGNKLFERRSEWDANGRKYASHYLIICHGCGQSDAIRFNRYNQSLPPDVIAKQFHHKGWVIGQTRKNDLCPQCVAALGRDRDRRKGVEATEKKRAMADTTINRSNAPPIPVDPGLVKREHYILLDRMAEVERQAKYLETTLEELVDIVADLRTEHSAIKRQLVGEVPAPQQQQQEPEMFTPLPTNRAEPALSHDRDRCYISYGAKRSTIRIGRNIADQLGLKPDSTVQVLRGDGPDEGYVQIAGATNGGGYKLRSLSRSADYNALALGTNYLRPASDEVVVMTELAHTIADGSLRLRLPDGFH